MPRLGTPFGTGVPLDLGPATLRPRVDGDPNPPVGGGTDWTGAFVGRSVANYKGSSSSVMGAADELAFVSQIVQPSVSRSVPFYRGPKAQTLGVFDQARSTDWLPAVVDRQTPFFRSPLSQAIPTFDNPPVVTSTDFVPPAISRAVPFYKGSYSSAIGAGDELAFVPQIVLPALSRAVAFYRGSRAQNISVFDQPAVVSNTDWATVVQSYRPPLSYRPLRSTTVVAWGSSIVTDAISMFVRSRLVPYYSGPRALIVTTSDNTPIVQAYVAPAVSRPPIVRVQRVSSVIFPQFSVFVAVVETQGGGGEWIIWVKPDFPNNRRGQYGGQFNKMDFRKPTRRVP